MSTDSTRHKSKNGETHNEAQADYRWILENLKEHIFKQTGIRLPINISEFTDKPVRANFSSIDYTESKSLTFDSLSQARKFFKNSTFSRAFYYDFKTELGLLVEEKPKYNGSLWEQLKEKSKEEVVDKDTNIEEVKKTDDVINIGGLGFWDMKRGEIFNYTNKGKEAEVDNSTDGIKETNGKLDYSEINFKLLDLMAKRFMENKVKYPKGNTKKTLDKNEILWAAFRHIRKMIQPIENDPETFEDHLAAVATNMSIILDQLEQQ